MATDKAAPAVQALFAADPDGQWLATGLGRSLTIAFRCVSASKLDLCSHAHGWRTAVSATAASAVLVVPSRLP
jgi:hypothetical protein